MLQSVVDQINSLEVLTASSLDQLHQKLCDELKGIESDVYQGLLSLLDGEPDEQQLQLVDEALSVLISRSDSSVQMVNKVRLLLSDYRKGRDEVSVVERELVSRKFRTDLEDQLTSFKQLNEQGNYSDAAWCLIGMERIIQDHKTNAEQNSEPSSELSIISAVETAGKEMNQMLISFYKDCLAVDLEKRILRIQTGAHLKEMWKASEILRQTNSTLETLSERIAAALTDSVLAVDAQEKINAAVDHGSGVIMFNWSAGTCDSIAEAVSSRFRIVGNLLEFLAGSLFVELHSLTEQVGSKLWPELQLDLSAKALAAGESLGENEKLQFLEAIFKEATSLEDSLKSSGYLEQDNCDFSSRISTASKAAFHKFSERYVFDARDAMKTRNWEALTVGKALRWDEKRILQSIGTATEVDPSFGIDLLHSPLGRGTYQITETVSHVQQIIEAAAIEGCSKGTLVLRSLVQGIRDICTMYNNIVPILFQKEIQVPQLGLLSANDFLYLCDEMLVLPLVIPNFKQLAPGIDFVQEARQLYRTGKRILQSQIALQTEAVKEVLNQAGDFGSLRTGQQGIALRRAVHQLTRMLSQLGRVLSQVLSLSDRCSVAIAVAEVKSPHVKYASTALYVSAQESEELPKVVQSLVDEVPQALLNFQADKIQSFENVFGHLQGKAVSQQQGFASDWLLYKRFKDGCKDLCKLKRLLQIWEARLKEIVEWWTSGQLREEGFTAEDVRNLVWALFEHSDRREDAIATIMYTA